MRYHGILAALSFLLGLSNAATITELPSEMIERIAESSLNTIVEEITNYKPERQDVEEIVENHKKGIRSLARSNKRIAPVLSKYMRMLKNFEKIYMDNLKHAEDGGYISEEDEAFATLIRRGKIHFDELPTDQYDLQKAYSNIGYGKIFQLEKLYEFYLGVLESNVELVLWNFRSEFIKIIAVEAMKKIDGTFLFSLLIKSMKVHDIEPSDETITLAHDPNENNQLAMRFATIYRLNNLKRVLLTDPRVKMPNQ